MSFTDPKFNYHGGKGIITEDYGTLVTDRTALSTCTAVFKIKQTSWTQLPNVNAPHPIFNYIGMERRELSFSGGWAIAKCSYAGIDDSSTQGTSPIYELVVGLSEEHIETHPDFVKKIGGTAHEPLNGAVFEQLGDDGGVIATWQEGHVSPNVDSRNCIFKKFSTFAPGKPDLNPFAKGEVYLSATGMTWRKTYNIKASLSTIRKAGKIDRPEGSPPDIDAGGKINWLNMGVNMTKRGSCYQCVQEWRASGRQGWNETVYGK